MIWQTTRFEIYLNRPKVMGIVNVTPDSFSDGG
jgi:dihydropteroate synthase